MTSQQRADEWLAVWRALRTCGLTPAQRDAVIEQQKELYHEARLFAALKAIRHEAALPPRPY